MRSPQALKAPPVIGPARRRDRKRADEHQRGCHVWGHGCRQLEDPRRPPRLLGDDEDPLRLRIDQQRLGVVRAVVRWIDERQPFEAGGDRAAVGRQSFRLGHAVDGALGAVQIVVADVGDEHAPACRGNGRPRCLPSRSRSRPADRFEPAGAPIRRSRRSARSRPSRCARTACADAAGCSPALTARAAGRRGLSRGARGPPVGSGAGAARGGETSPSAASWPAAVSGSRRPTSAASSAPASVSTPSAVVVGRAGHDAFDVGIAVADRVGAGIRARAAAAATSGDAEPEKQCNYGRERVNRGARQDRNYHTSRVVDASNVSELERDSRCAEARGFAALRIRGSLRLAVASCGRTIGDGGRADSVWPAES